MSWIHKFRVIGKPTITGDKPGSQLEKVLAEIQSKAITLIEADNKAVSGGAANVNIKLRRIKNDVTISAEVDMPELGNVLPDGTEQHQVLVWDGNAWAPDWVRAT